MSAAKRKRDKPREEQWTKLVRPMMQTDAWRALPPVAQALYPWLKFEWKGPKANNNGKISLSLRQAADRLGVGIDTAGRGFHALQQKGFLVVVKAGTLGSEGGAKAPEYELTELPLPSSDRAEGRKLYREWREGEDFPVHRTRTNNPAGRNGRAPSKKKPRHHDHDGAVIEIMTVSGRQSSKP